ncbi:MAG: hypothetical protein ACXQTS_06710 [Candidatus Methanospirareceae archaeon]
MLVLKKREPIATYKIETVSYDEFTSNEAIEYAKNENVEIICDGDRREVHIIMKFP